MSKATAQPQNQATPARRADSGESAVGRFHDAPISRSASGGEIPLQRAERLGHRVGVTFTVGGRGVIQRLPADQIEVGHTYRYNDVDGGEKTGVLQAENDGTYTFDNGSAQGNVNVIEEVDGGGGGDAEADLDVEVDAAALEDAAVDGGGGGGGGGEDGAEGGGQAQVQVGAVVDDADGDGDDGGGGGDAEEAPATAAALITQIAAEFNIDPAADRDLLSVALEVAPAGYAMDFGGDEIYDAVGAYLADWHGYTSCHDTANRFIGVFGDADVQATTVVQSEAAEPGAAGERAAALAGGADDIAGYLVDGRIIRVRYAGHSFMVMGRGERADMLQSFANKFPLADSIAADISFEIDTARDNLRDAIGSDDQATRIAAQTALSGHRIEDDKVYPVAGAWPNVELEYEVKALIDPAAIMLAIRGIIQAAVDELRRLGKIP